MRATYERRLASGKPGAGLAEAAAALAVRPFPESVRYLLDWCRELHGRSGVGMSGLAPLSYPVIAEWARLSGNEPTWSEVQTLLCLDLVLLHPETD